MKPTSAFRRLLAIAGSSLLAVSSAHAADGTWNVDADGLWGTPGNWTPGIADLSGFTAYFTNDIMADRTVSLDGVRTLTSVVFGDIDPTTAGSWLLDNNVNVANTLTLAGTTPGITVNALGTAKTATISAIIAGSAGLVKSGDGTLILSGLNTYTGTTTISAGTLRLQGAAPLNTGRTYTINGGAVMNLNGGATFNTSVAGSSTINGTGTLRFSSGGYGRGAGGGGTLTAALGAGGLIDIQSGASFATWYNTVLLFTGNLATLNVDGSIDGNGALTIIAAALTGAGTINNSGTTVNIGNGSGTFSGRIRNSTSVTKNGTGTQTLSGDNDYSGTTTVTAGVLNIQHANALGTTAGSTSVASNAALELQHATGIAIGAEAITISGGGISNGGAIRNIAGSNTYGGTVTLAARSRINSDSGTLTLSNATSVTGGAFGLVVGGDGNITISGAFTTSFATALLKSDGAGTLTLSATNSYTGTTQVSAGTLALGHATDTLASASAVIVDGATAILSIAGNSDTVGAVSLRNGAQITGSGGTLTGSSYAVESGSVSAILGGTSVALTKSTTGTVTLTGANSYTGATTVNGGTLLLDMTGSGALATTSALTLGGGTFKVLGKSGAVATAQTLAALTVNAGGSQIVLDANGGTSTTLTLADSAPTRAAGGTLAVDLSIPNTVLASTLGLAADSQTPAQAVLGYATVKDATSTGFATNVGGNIVRYTGAEELLAASNSGTTNHKITPVGTTTTGSPLLTTAASAAYNSLSIDTSGATGANFLGLNGTVSLTQNALLMTGGNDFTIQGGTQLGAAATELIIHQAGAGTLTISSVISSSTGSLTKTGSGTLILTGNNAYTGATTINAGTMRMEGMNPINGANRTYSIAPNAVLNFNGVGNLTKVITINGTGTFRISNGYFQNPNVSANITWNLGAGGLIDIQSGAAFATWYSFGTNWTGNQATLNVDGTIEGNTGMTINAAALTGAGTINNSGTTLSLGVNNGSGTFSGRIRSSASLTKTGSGTQTLSGNNDYTGVTTVSGGTLQFAKANSLLAANWTKTLVTVNSGGTIAFNVGGTGEFTTANVTTLLSGLGGAVNNNGLRSGSAIAFDTSNASGGTFTIADTLANTTSTGGGAVGLTKLGTNTLVLSGPNSYTGVTTVNANAGTLQFAKANSLPAANWTKTMVTVNSGGTIAFNVGGTNEFTPGNVTTLLSGLGGVVSNNGLRSGSTIAFDTSNASGGTFTVADAIADTTGTGGGAVGIRKLGTNTLVLSGPNTYTGPTTVSAGTLAVNGTHTGGGLITVSATATLGGSGSTGAVTVENGGTLAAGSSIESLGVASAVFDAGSTFAYEFQTSSLAADLVDSTGALGITSGAILTLTDLGPSTALAPGSKLTLVSYTGSAPLGVFTHDGSPLADGGIKTIGANQWQFNYADTTGGDNFTADQSGATKYFTMTVAVPEAGTAGLLALGLLLLRRLRA